MEVGIGPMDVADAIYDTHLYNFTEISESVETKLLEM